MRKTIIVLMCLLVSANVFSQGNPEGLSGTNPRQLTSEFLNPDLKYAPMVRWWWPGNDVENTELQRELELFSSNHIGGVEIQPFALVIPIPKGKESAVMSFDTDSYYEHLSTVMTKASELGMTVDLTNGSGWPASSPMITEAEENRSLQYGLAFIPEAGGTVTIPRSTRQDSEFSTLIGLLEAQVQENENQPWQIKNVKELPHADKTVTFSPAKVEKGWKRCLIALWSVPSQEINMITARPDGGKVIDHLDSLVVQKTYNYYFGERTGLVPFYGKPFRSIFNDSYEFKVDRHITADFREVFQQRRGYDPLPWMPANIWYGYNNMYDAGKGYAEFTFGDVDARLRYDYDLTVSDLVRTHLLRGSSHWARERGLQHKTQPYGLPMDYMGAAGDADIPETENMIFGGGSRGGLKMVYSGAMLYGKPRVTAESGVHFGRALLVTPQKLRMTVDKNISSGINQLIWHGAPYKYGEDGKWQPFFNGAMGINFSSDFYEANHFWEEMSAVNHYAQRSQYLMQQGKATADVLVYYPFLDFCEQSHHPEELLWNGYLPETEPAMTLNDEIPAGSKSGHWLQHIWPVLDELERKGITWAWVNDESLQQMTTKSDGSLQIRGNVYKGLVLFELPHIQLATAQNLAKMNNTNILLLGDVPTAQPSFLDYEKNDRETARLMDIAAHGKNVCRELGKWNIALPVKTLSGGERIRLVRRDLGNGTFIQMYWNEDTHAKTLCLKTDAAYAYWMNAEDGSIIEATKDKDACIRETLEPLDTRFLYLGNAPLEGVSKKTSSENSVLATLTKWNLSTKNVSLEGITPGDWRDIAQLEDSDEDAVYTTTFTLSEKEPGKRYSLNLGKVCYVAEVLVNGKSVGKRMWMPYIFTVTDYLQPGENTIEIRVKVSDYNAKARQGREGDPNFGSLANGGRIANGLLGPVQLLVSAQNQEGQGNSLSKLMTMLDQMTDEQKAYARANWLEAPETYVNQHDHPSKYIISPNPAPDTQSTFECAGCSSAYLLRFYGENVNGVELFHQPTFPCKHSEGAYPKCFKVLFEQQYTNYTAEYYTGTTDDLKNAVSKGTPVIVLLFNGKTLHYVPVVGYDEEHFYIQDSVDEYRNVDDSKSFNRSVEIPVFDKMWNIPIESCERLFVVVRKK